MPRARSRRSSRAVWISASICVSISAARAGSRRQVAREPRLHGQRDQLLLRAVVDVAFEPAALPVLRLTSRRCEERSSTSRTFRRTRPAWDARSRTRRSFDGFIGSLGGIATERPPRSSPGPGPRRRSRPRSSGGHRSSRGRPAHSASVGHEAAGRSPRPGGATPWPRRRPSPGRGSAPCDRGRPPSRTDSPTRSRTRSAPRTGSPACRRRRDRRCAARTSSPAGTRDRAAARR